MAVFAYGFLQHNESTLFSFLTEFSAGLLGVYLAFTLDRTVENRKKEKERKDLLCDLRDELEESKAKLTGKGNLHFPDIWKSAISSGQIRLLTSEQVRKLSKVYRRIQAIEYEAKVVRQNREILATCEPLQRDIVAKRHGILSSILIENETKLCNEISELLRENWWKE